MHLGNSKLDVSNVISLGCSIPILIAPILKRILWFMNTEARRNAFATWTAESRSLCKPGRSQMLLEIIPDITCCKLHCFLKNWWLRHFSFVYKLLVPGRAVNRLPLRQATEWGKILEDDVRTHTRPLFKLRWLNGQIECQCPRITLKLSFA